jgi:hypothetical protein
MRKFTLALLAQKFKTIYIFFFVGQHNPFVILGEVDPQATWWPPLNPFLFKESPILFNEVAS